MKGNEIRRREVRADWIAVAGAKPSGQGRPLGVIRNDPEAVGKLIRQLGPPVSWRTCSEAGPCGDARSWPLTPLGVAGLDGAPTLGPGKAGPRLQPDRREAATRALPRRPKGLLRPGQRTPPDLTAWTVRRRQGLGPLRFAHAAPTATSADSLGAGEHDTARIRRLERAIAAAVATASASPRAGLAAGLAMRGVGAGTAATIGAGVGPLGRVDRPRPLMAYPRRRVPRRLPWNPGPPGRHPEDGNAPLRRGVIDAAGASQPRPTIGPMLRPAPPPSQPAQPRLQDRSPHLGGNLTGLRFSTTGSTRRTWSGCRRRRRPPRG
jgi:hypothetical protein